jgi:hypothetical protein
VFGLVTRRELEKAIAAADAERKRELEEIAFEWARWFDKFRTLYAQWVKRDKKAAEDAPGSTIDAGADGSAPRAVAYDRPFPNSRRGF